MGVGRSELNRVVRKGSVLDYNVFLLQYMKVEQVQSVIGEIPDFRLGVLSLKQLEGELFDGKRELRRSQ